MWLSALISPETQRARHLLLGGDFRYLQQMRLRHESWRGIRHNYQGELKPGRELLTLLPTSIVVGPFVKRGLTKTRPFPLLHSVPLSEKRKREFRQPRLLRSCL